MGSACVPVSVHSAGLCPLPELLLGSPSRLHASLITLPHPTHAPTSHPHKPSIFLGLTAPSLLTPLSQVYGFGKSEEFLGEFMKATGTSPIIATKYAPQPWRLSQGSVPAACKASLARLQLQQMGLYIQHW